MADSTLNQFHSSGTTVERLAFTPTPPTPASGPDHGYTWFDTDLTTLYAWDGAAWQPAIVGGAGTVTHTAGALTAGKTVVGNGAADITVSALTTQFVGSTAGTQAAASMSTGKLLGRTTAASGAVEEITPGASMSFTAGALNGRVVQVVNTQTGTAATGTTVIPFDNTIPQNTEGDQYMSLAITPTSATNKLRIEVLTWATNTAGSAWIIAALFQDTTANALDANAILSLTSTAGGFVKIDYYMTAGTTSATTFKVRMGASTGGTTTFNGQGGVALFGGVLMSSITITEITV